MKFEEFKQSLNFSDEEKLKVVEQLKLLTQHIEEGKWPMLIYYKCEKAGFGLKFEIDLSHPWPG